MQVLDFQHFATLPYWKIIDSLIEPFSRQVADNFQCKIRFERAGSNFSRVVNTVNQPTARQSHIPLYIGGELVFQLIVDERHIGCFVINELVPLEVEDMRHLQELLNLQITSRLQNINRKKTNKSNSEEPKQTHNLTIIAVKNTEALDIRKKVHDLHMASPRISFLSTDELRFDNLESYRDLLKLRDCTLFIPDIEETNHSLQSVLVGFSDLSFFQGATKIYVGIKKSPEDLGSRNLFEPLLNIIQTNHFDVSRAQFLKILDSVSRLELTPSQTETEALKRLISLTKNLSLVH
jgi:hypothetical protein